MGGGGGGWIWVCQRMDVGVYRWCGYMDECSCVWRSVWVHQLVGVSKLVWLCHSLVWLLLST